MMEDRSAKLRTSEMISLMEAALDNGQSEAALTWAERIIAKRPLNRSAVERALGVCLDCQQAAAAQEGLAFLEERFPSAGPQRLLYGMRLSEMLGDYRQALQQGEEAVHILRREGGEAWLVSLAFNHMAGLYKLLGRPREAAALYLEDSRIQVQAGRMAEARSEYSNYFFNLHFFEQDKAALKQAADGYQALFAGVRPFSHDRERHASHGRLRLGYISPDLCSHVVAAFAFYQLERYDKEHFEVYAYANCREDDLSREFADHVDHWRNILLLSHYQVAQLIYDDEIDILIDLAGHTANGCLPVLAYKPAPVQLTGIGWFDTTGLTAVDYFLADGYLDPVGLNDAYFSEKLLRLPQTHLCAYWHGKPEESTVAPAPCLRNGFVTFGCFNRMAKLTDEVLQVWANVLAGSPGSRLFLKDRALGTDYGRMLMKERLARAGIDAGRVDMEGHTVDYLAAYGRVDIALDTFPYPGGFTTFDALYMGVPVVTKLGKSHHGRFGYSILMNLELPELCADSDEGYVGICTALAADRGLLQGLRGVLRSKAEASPLFDGGLYMRNLEAMYCKIWQDYLESADG